MLVTSGRLKLPEERLRRFWQDRHFRRASGENGDQASVAARVATLTAEQRRAVTSRVHALEGCAGARSGTTSTLTGGYARLAGEGSPEHRLMALTFTRDARAGFTSRPGSLLGK